MSDDLFDGQQHFDELKKLKKLKIDNKKKSFLDVLFKLNPEKSKEYTASTNDKSTMTKVTTEATIREAIEESFKQNDYLIVGEKIDGLSLYLTYNNEGTLIYAEQRGNGVVSVPIPLTDIYIIPNIKKQIDISHLNLKEGETIEIQGEVVLENSNLDKLNTIRREKNKTPYKNPRSATSGCINKKENMDFLKFKSFLMYKKIDNEVGKYTFEKMYETLLKNKMEQPNIFIVKNIDDFFKIYDLYDKNDSEHIDFNEIQDLLKYKNNDVSWN